MFKLLRMTLLSLPLAGGVALAQSTPVDGPQAINPTAATGTTDTRTPTQKTASDIDTGDGTVPRDLVPGNGVRTAPLSNTAGMPDDKQVDSTTTLEKKTHKKVHKSSSGTDATPMVNPENGIDNSSTTTKSTTTDYQHDTQNSDK